MRPLNRPMFKYGGPIKEGIMTGMKSKPALVGDPVYPKGSDGRSQYGYGTAAAQFFGRVSPFLKNVYQGIRTPTAFEPAKTGIMSKVPQFIQKMLPSGRFRTTTNVPGQGNILTEAQIKAGMIPTKGTRSVLEALKDPKSLGMAIRENKLLAASTPTLTYNTATTGGPILIDTAKGFANFLVPGTKFDPFKDKGNIKETGGDTPIERLDKNKNVGGGDTGGDPNTSAKTDAEKQKITEDRIQETKNKYYKLMGIDKMNKEAVYDSLIDASKVIQAEGGDLKGSIKSGSLQTQLIDAISKNLDKSADLKKKIDSAVLSAEIQKDINKTKMSDFDKQLAILGPEGYRRKALGETSVAEMIAATKAKNTLVNSDIVTSFIESKGGKVTDTFDDTKFQKWEKNNTGKDEIDYITENFSTIDPGVYVVNGKAVQIGISKEGKKTANYINLDTIIG